jgi:hypothetical protein
VRDEIGRGEGGMEWRRRVLEIKLIFLEKLRKIWRDSVIILSLVAEIKFMNSPLERGLLNTTP